MFEQNLSHRKQHGQSLCLQNVLGPENQYFSPLENDKISAFGFNHSGSHVCIGNHEGRLVIFKYLDEENTYEFMLETQAYLEFHDWQQHKQIKPRINDIQWMKGYSNTFKLISTNDKLIKIWKLKECPVVQHNQKEEFHFSPPSVREFVTQPQIILTEEFPNLHAGSIKHINLSHNEQYLLSSDGDHIKQWSLENTKKPCMIHKNEQERPLTQQDEWWQLLETITAVKYHCRFDNRLAFSTKFGTVNYLDLRLSSKRAISIRLHNQLKISDSQLQKYITAVSDFHFHPLNTDYLISRDYLNTYLWDFRWPSKPILKVAVYPPTLHQLCKLYQECNIFDQFKIHVNQNNGKLLTPHYDQHFHEIDFNLGQNYRYQIDLNKPVLQGENVKNCQNANQLTIDPKVNFAEYSPDGETIGVASNNCVFFYKKQL